MKKSKLIIIALLLLFIPFATNAFSWRSLIFWQKEKPAIVQPVPKEFNETQKKVAVQKTAQWQEAFNKKNWDKLIKDKNNFQFSEDEINFLLTDALKKEANFPATNIKISLSDDKATLTGQLITPIKGNFETVVKIDTVDQQIVPIIEKMKFKGIPLPKFYINNIIQKYLPQLTSFLYTYPNYKGVDVLINDGTLQLNYK